MASFEALSSWNGCGICGWETPFPTPGSFDREKKTTEKVRKTPKGSPMQSFKHEFLKGYSSFPECVHRLYLGNKSRYDISPTVGRSLGQRWPLFEFEGIKQQKSG